MSQADIHAGYDPIQWGNSLAESEQAESDEACVKGAYLNNLLKFVNSQDGP